MKIFSNEKYLVMKIFSNEKYLVMKNMQFIAIKGNCSSPGRGGGGGEELNQ